MLTVCDKKSTGRIEVEVECDRSGQFRSTYAKALVKCFRESLLYMIILHAKNGVNVGPLQISRCAV